jgi:hypothetical protein
MIPMVLAVRVHAHPDKAVRVWIPLFLVWLLLLPFVLVLAPIAMIVALVLGFNVWRGTGAIVSVFTGLSGLRVDVEAPGASVLVNIQ